MFNWLKVCFQSPHHRNIWSGWCLPRLIHAAVAQFVVEYLHLGALETHFSEFFTMNQLLAIRLNMRNRQKEV